MYLHELKIWNFRKYGIKGDKFEDSKPGMAVQFNEGVNLLVGENDSGKTTIIDAIRYVLKTQSLEFIQLEEKDFYKAEGKGEEYRSSELKIECTFKGFSENGSDASHFLEWNGFDEANNYILKVWLYAKRKDNYIVQNTRAGMDGEGIRIDGEARELLRVIYLKPLRDALSEMTHGNKSRLAQILKSIDVFKKDKEDGREKKHELENNYENLKKEVDKYFEEGGGGAQIQKTINDLLQINFFLVNDNRKAGITLTGNDLGDILKQLDLVLEENKSGLGSLNLLFIAAELLLLFERKVGLKLTLIEELEAHLHPQYQLRIIDYIQSPRKEFGQFILTTHSTTLASKIDLENLIICNKSGDAFPMGHIHTKLEWGDYSFLQRFLNATKANLFFAKGVLLVEGDAENLLLPTLAEIIDRPLHKYGVSIVNIGNTAFLRYSRIFLRNEEPYINIPVSIITDLDIKPLEYYIKYSEPIVVYKIKPENIESLKKIYLEIHYNEIQDIPFTSKSSFNSAINEKKTGRLSFKQRNQIISECEVLAGNEDILHFKASSKNHKEIVYTHQTVKAFVAGHWTLEYDIALSIIKQELYEAIQRASFLMANNELELTEDDKVAIKEDVKLFFSDNISKTPEELAFEIYFNSLLSKQISKAITAQCLSEILIENGGKDYYCDIIKNDEYLKYLVDAICHVTKKYELETPTKEGGNNEW